MSFLNIELKAHCHNPEFIEEILKQEKAKFHGTDFQTDTYFNTNEGRLKLREGNIENSLIFYHRDNKPGPKKSNVILYKPSPGKSLKEILTTANGVKVIVNKERKIYFIANIKFHIDRIEKLGSFVEIEAIDMEGNIGIEKLREQCQRYINKFSIEDRDLISESYSDLLLDKLKKNEK